MNENDHLIKLESKIAYLENDIDELNSVLLAQSKRIDQLVKQIEELNQKLDQKKDMDDDLKEEKPPHY